MYFEAAVPLCGVSVGMTYAESLATVFGQLHRANSPDLTDPSGVSRTPVAVAATRTQREGVRVALAQSAERASRALAAESKGRVQEALRIWALVFNHT